MSDPKKRLMSLDVLRGLDMFLLIIAPGIVKSLFRTGHCNWLSGLEQQLCHSNWTGFTLWDLLMPLFVFTAGASVPLAFAKYRAEGRSNGKIYIRIIRRVIVLWILGMVSQGNLLSLDPAQFHYFGNTLQVIAFGYLVSSILFLNSKPKTHVIVCVILMLAYWVLMTFCTAAGCGAGDFTKEGNFCRGFSIWSSKFIRLNLNREWIFQLLNMSTTAITGMLATEIIKSEKRTELNRIEFMLACGALMVAAALLINMQMPVIKHLWTTSFVFLTSGISFLLYGSLYWMIDMKGWKKGWIWLLPFGMNAILAYMLRSLVLLGHHPSEVILYGLSNWLSPEWYKCAISMADKALLWWLLWIFYKHKIFVKV